MNEDRFEELTAFITAQRDTDWLAGVIRRAKADALEEAATAISQDDTAAVEIALGGVDYASYWLFERGAAIRQEDHK